MAQSNNYQDELKWKFDYSETIYNNILSVFDRMAILVIELCHDEK